MGPLAAGLAGAGLSAGIGAIGSFLTGKSSQSAAERAYKHRYQWQVKDLEKAGLNPMLAVSQGAPNVPQGNFPDMGQAASRGVEAFSAKTAATLAQAQGKNLEASALANTAQAKLSEAGTAKALEEARLTGITADIAKEDVPYAAGTSREKYYKLAGERLKIANEAEQISENIKITEQNYLHLAELQPLLRTYQALMNRAKELEIPAAAAEAAFWEALPEAAWVKKLRDVMPSFPKGIGFGKK